MVLNQMPSFAVPGEAAQQSRSRIQNSTLFPGMQLPEEEEWPINIAEVNTYIGSHDYNGGEAVIYVHGENGIVTSEVLQFRYPNSPISLSEIMKTG